jgi:two-component system OmpR family sensor kinase
MAERKRRPTLRAVRRWPVRWRLAGVSAGLTLLILLSFAVIVGRLATDKLKDDFRDELQSNANEIATELQLGDPRNAVKNMVAVGDGVLRIVDAEGDPVGGTASAPSFGPPQPEILRVGAYDVAATRISSNSLTEPALFVQYAQTRASLDSTLDRVWLLLALGVLGGTVLALLAGLTVAGRAMRPISSLTAVAREIATTRDPSQRIPMPESDDEVAELAQTLDQMLRELDAARAETQLMIQAQRDFVADASHELRTPLTSILANLELLEASLAEREADADEEAIVAGALGSSRRMRRLVADLLLLARADAGRVGPQRSCDLGEIAAGAVAEVRPVADGHTLELELGEPATVEGNPDDLHRLIVNLVENGVRHTPLGSTVAVSVGAIDGEGVLEVTDDGPGLPEGVGDQIFARFVRGAGPADLAADSGTGLGLAIVKAVATSHHGRVDVGRATSGGARFTVHLPLRESTPATPAVL